MPCIKFSLSIADKAAGTSFATRSPNPVNNQNLDPETTVRGSKVRVVHNGVVDYEGMWVGPACGRSFDPACAEHCCELSRVFSFRTHCAAHRIQWDLAKVGVSDASDGAIKHAGRNRERAGPATCAPPCPCATPHIFWIRQVDSPEKNRRCFCRVGVG